MTRLVQKVKPSGHKILIVDDVEEILESTRVLLEKDGHEIQTADNGRDGVEFVRKWEPHLLILDYFMPGMTGEEVVSEIRPFNREVQILLQTGYASEKPPRDMLRKLDIQGYHDKTDGPEKLLLWVDVSLKSYRQARMLWSLLKRSGLTRTDAAETAAEATSPAAAQASATTAGVAVQAQAATTAGAVQTLVGMPSTETHAAELPALLLADRVEGFRNVLKASLAKFYSVQAVGSSEDALRAASGVDVLVVDAGLCTPDLIAVARQSNPNVQILVFVDEDGSTPPPPGLPSLTKPFTVKTLLALLKELH